MKNEIASLERSLLVIVLLFISVGQSFAQKVIWKEGFITVDNTNRGVFTVDFSGIENNHEVEILLCNIENGQIVYKTTFLSQSVEHNKVDVVPANAVEPGRYICALVCEGIRLNTTVVIH